LLNRSSASPESLIPAPIHDSIPAGAPSPTNLPPPPTSGIYTRTHASRLQALPPPSVPSTLAPNPASSPLNTPSPAVSPSVLTPTSAPPGFQDGPVPATNVTAPSPSPSGVNLLSLLAFYLRIHISHLEGL
jgi:hypothetical protein